MIFLSHILFLIFLHRQIKIFLILTVIIGNRGSDIIDGDNCDCDCGFASLFAIANCNCSYFGPRRYRSKLKLTTCPVERNNSTASWFVKPCKDFPST